MINIIRPKKTFSSKSRIGSNNDGGYVVSNTSMEMCDVLFTYGVGPTSVFEKDFAKKYSKHVYMFDHTIGKAKYDKGFLHFIPEGLGLNQLHCKDFLTHYKELNISGKVLLKIDVEGAEYEYFNNCNIEHIAEITTGLILEVHQWQKAKNYDRCIKMLSAINEYFIPVHLHGNNNASTKLFENFIIPRTFEISYVNKAYDKDLGYDKQEYPIKGLDYPNRKSKEDIPLTFCSI